VMNLVIREAEPSDASDLLRLYVQLASPGTEAPTIEEAEIALHDAQGAPWLHVLVAEIEGDVVGTATVAVIPSVAHERRPWGQIENVVVDEQHRLGGIGEALVERCEAITRGAGGYKVQLVSSGHRKGAHAFYERIGFGPSFAAFRKYL
jgi:GNAT superfamily N-acetyltransferase